MEGPGQGFKNVMWHLAITTYDNCKFYNNFCCVCAQRLKASKSRLNHHYECKHPDVEPGWLLFRTQPLDGETAYLNWHDHRQDPTTKLAERRKLIDKRAPKEIAK